MNPENNIEKQLEQLAKAIPSGTSFVDGVMDRIETSSDTLQKQTIHINLVRRLFMKTSVKFAAAAIVLIAAFLSLTLFKTVPTAYALEQTIEASRDLRFIHLHCEPAGEGVEDMWVQFDDQGQILHLRMNFPNTADGPKDVVWQEGKAQVWSKAKKIAVVLQEEAMLARLKMSYYEFDPKSIVQGLYENNRQGQIEIQESQSPDEPIIITHTLDNHRSLFKVDPQTRLLQQIDKYELQNGEYKFLGLIQYLDYNQPVDPEIFVLSPPTDVVHIDQTNQVIGLEQGQMTDDEVAIEVVRQFWQAIMVNDYQTAGQLMEGLPADTVKKLFVENFKTKVIKIISVGPVQPHPKPETRGVIVPCTIEYEMNGQTLQRTFDHIGVRQVYNQPRRWTIFGGI